MKNRPIAAALVGAMALLLGLSPGEAHGCSAPFERPTIRALGPAQLVVFGRVGARVPGGRLFHVDRWFNGGDPITPIVIGFKEGEPVGDCSYPVQTGERKVIAPFRQPDGTLYADLGTLQAEPTSADGLRYLAEAESLFGPGVVPVPVEPEPAVDAPIPTWVLVAVALLAIAVATLGVLTLRGRFARPRAP
jgi:hypothetical protein